MKPVADVIDEVAFGIVFHALGSPAALVTLLPGSGGSRGGPPRADPGGGAGGEIGGRKAVRFRPAAEGPASARDRRNSSRPVGGFEGGFPGQFRRRERCTDMYKNDKG